VFSSRAHAQPFPSVAFNPSQRPGLISLCFSSHTVQPWASDFASLDIGLTFSKVILIKSASRGCYEEPQRTIGKTLIDFI